MCYEDAAQSHLRVAVTTILSRDLSQAQVEQLREVIDDSIPQAVLSPPSPNQHAPSFGGHPILTNTVLAMWCEDANALSKLEKTAKTIALPIQDTTLTAKEAQGWIFG